MIWLALAVAVFGVIANHAREVYKERKYREMFGTLFWAVVPIAIISLIWVANENPLVMARTITLGFVGAALGAFALIWCGYLVHDWSAVAQTAVPVEPSSAPTGSTGVDVKGTAAQSSGGIRGNKFFIGRMSGPPGSKGIVMEGQGIEDNEFHVNEMDLGATRKPSDPKPR